MSRRLAVFAGLFSIGLLAAVVVMLATGGPGLAGSTGVPPDAFVVSLSPGRSACQVSGPLPGDTDTAQLVVGTPEGERVRLGFSAQHGDKEVARGFVSGSPGTVRLPVRGDTAGSVIDHICVSNLGRKRVVLAGRPGGPATLAGTGRALDATISVLYLRSNSPSWLSQAGVISARFDHVRLSFMGPATLWFALFLAAAAGTGAIIATVSVRRD